MNFPPPVWVKKAAEEALGVVSANHYSHPKGRIRLREAIKNFYGPQFNRDLDVEKEILVTSGANEGKFIPLFRLNLNRQTISGEYAVLTAFLEQDDEVIMFEPFFDQYLPSITFNAGKPIYVPLHPPTSASGKFSSDEWKIDPEELE